MPGNPLGQHQAAVRFDWGLPGAQALSSGDAHPLFVIVDVLSFSTSVTVAVERGIDVFPCRWRDERAERLAGSLGAVLARGRSERGVSLSPASLLDAGDVRRLVLPSPNGSSIAHALQERGEVVIGCLRNARAVGFGSARHRGPVVVVAAGERWPDGSLRPAVEDLWGAGAVIAAMRAAGADGLSPEALHAAAAYAAVAGDLGEALDGCASGRELIERGFARDVAIAADADSTAVVPRMLDGAFTE